MRAPARQLLPQLQILFGRICAEFRIAIVHERNGVVDAGVAVTGKRRRHVARIAHDDDGAVGAARAGEQWLAQRRQRISVMDLDEAHGRRRFARVPFVVIGAARQFLIEARTQAVRFVMGEKARVDQKQIVERTARAGNVARCGLDR